MRLTLASIGRLKAGPERELFERYLRRSRDLGRRLGFRSIDVLELDESAARTAEQRRRAEAADLLARVPAGSALILLEQSGSALSSEAFAARVEASRHEGAPALVLAVGGPDGFDPDLRPRAVITVSFGRATFPHGLVRILLAEQVYRAFTILAGHPYHRG